MKQETFSLEQSPIKPGENFDSEKEIKNILKSPKEERKQKVEEFKKKLTFQKVGLARVQDILIDEIRSNPNGKIDDFYDMAVDLGFEFGMNKTQKRDTKEFLLRYEGQHKAIEKIRKEFPLDKDLFRFLFNKVPKGKVEIIRGPVSLYFKCYDFDDYMAVCFHYKMRGSGKKRDFTKEEREEAQGTGAVNVFSEAYPDIGWAITAENTSRITLLGDKENASLQRFNHEEQHVIKSLFDKEEFVNSEILSDVSSVRQKFLSKTTEKEKENILSGFFYEFVRNAEEYAKDEILAYYKDGRLNLVYDELITPEEEGGVYDYLSEQRKTDYQWGEQIEDSSIHNLSENVKKRVLVEEYKLVLATGINSIKKMEENGYDKEEIVALLVHEPLIRWGKVVNRVLEVG